MLYESDGCRTIEKMAQKSTFTEACTKNSKKGFWVLLKFLLIDANALKKIKACQK
jgi:hypothetical protein